MLIAITSARDNYMQRWMIRQTFKLDPDFNSSSMLFFFALGLPDRMESNTTTLRVAQEQQTTTDIMIAPFVDNYQNLSLKTFYIYQEAMKRIEQDPLIGKILFYDDDCIIDLGRIRYHIDKHVGL